MDKQDRNDDGGAFTPREAAELAQAEHADMVNMIMLTIDLLDQAQRGEPRINVPNLRRAAGRKMRRSAAGHAVAVAGLLVDVDEPHSRRLVAYADEIAPATEGSR